MNKKYLEMLTISLLIIFGFYYIYLAALTPMLGEDEMRVAYMKTMLSGDIFPKNYGDAGQALFLYSAAAPLSILTAPLVAGHIISALLGALILLFSYLFGKLVKNIYFSLILILAILSFPLLFHISMIAYQDGAIAFFSLLAIYSFTKWYKNKTLEDLIIFSLFVCISYFIKLSGFLIIFIAFFALAVFSFKEKTYKHLIIFTVIALLLFVPTIIRNIILFNYPFFEGLNYFFKVPEQWQASWVKEIAKLITPEKISLSSFLNFGTIPLILYFSFLLFLFINRKEVEPCFIFSSCVPIVFMLAFVFMSLNGVVLEDRYFTITFPSLAITTAFIIYKLIENSVERRFINLGAALAILLIFLIYDFSTFVTIQNTSNSIRYTPEYMKALNWIKANTNQNDLIFAVYGGSAQVYAEREIIQPGVIEDFPKLMRESNATFDYEVLKGYNISYILIWTAAVGSDYIIPQSNIWGAFTPTFINTLLSDPEHFEKVFGNKETIIFRLK